MGTGFQNRFRIGAGSDGGQVSYGRGTVDAILGATSRTPVKSGNVSG